MPDPIINEQSYYERKPFSQQHFTVDMGEQTLQSTGGNLSSRKMLSVTDEAGNVINGFFTQNEYNSREEIFDSLFPPASRQNTPERTEYGQYLNSLWSPDRLYGNKGSSYQLVKDFAKKFMSPLQYNSSKDNVRKCAAFFKESLAQKDGASFDAQVFFLGWMTENEMLTGGQNDAQSAAWEQHTKDPEFWNYLADLHSAAAVADRTFKIQNLAFSQSENSSINKRNNAMYEYAALLGEPDLLAKSSAMTIKQGDKVIHGTFMQSAKGIERSAMFDKALQDGKNSIVFSGSAMQQLSKMQVLDYLCGNRDRHYNNWLYQTEETPDGVKIVGIQGIDNDASFITSDHRGPGTTAYMSHLEDIKIMDSGMAWKIANLKPENIEELMNRAELSGEEITAAKRRLTDLQNRLGHGSIKVIEGAEGWDKEYANNRRFRNLTYDRKGDEAKNIEAGANIFQLAIEVSRNYRKEFDQKQNAQTQAEPKNEARNIQQNPQQDAPAASPFAHGTSLNTTDDLRLSHLSERLNAYKAKLNQSKSTSLDPVKAQLNSTLAFIGRLDTHLADLKAKKKPAVLNDNMRNFLAESLKDLSKQAETYAKNHSADVNSNDKATRGIFDTTKNMAAFSRFSRQSIQRDTTEAEMTDVSRKADILRKKADILWKKADIKVKISLPDLMAPEYSRLAQKLSSVDKSYIRSSDKFKKMMASFAALKNSPDKYKAYTELNAQAQAYLDYKSKERKPSDYAKSRIAFAKEILEFSKSGKAFEEPNGCRKMCDQAIRFHNDCADVLNKYANSKALLEFQQEEAKEAGKSNDPARKQSADKAVLEAQTALKNAESSVYQHGPKFVKDFMDMKKNSESLTSPNPQNRYLQKLCQTLITDPNSAILSFANKHAEITDQRSKMPQNTTKPFDSMQIGNFASDFKDSLTKTISNMSQKPQKSETKQVQPTKKQPVLK